LNGKIIKTDQIVAYDTDSNWIVYRWDGTNQSGSGVRNGMYLFQINISDLNTQKTQKVGGKMVLKR
jgi:flagellar hook assembly protein FlgD